MTAKDVEARIRAAYASRAEQVTPSNLMYSTSVWESTGLKRARPHHRSYVAVAAAVAIVAGVAAGAALILRDNQPTRATDQQHFVPVPPVAQITAGWTVALWAPEARAAKVEILLTNPGGQTSILGRVRNESPQIADWSVSHARLLITFGVRYVRADVVDLTTRTVSNFAIPTSAAQFAVPDGSRIAVATGSGIREYSTKGKLIASYANVQSVAPVRVSGVNGEAFVDNHALVLRPVGGTETVIQLPGAAGTGCRVLRAWSVESVLLSCERSGLWLVGTDGRSRILYHQASGSAPALDAWRSGGRIYLQIASSCGAPRLAVARAGGRSRYVAPPFAYQEFVGHAGEELFFVSGSASPCSAPSGRLVAWKPGETTARDAVPGLHPTTGFVLSAQLAAG